MFQTAYCQLAGAGKARNQDALFNGAEVKQAKRIRAKIFTPLPDDNGLIQAAVADGVSHSPAPHLASRFWMQAFAASGRADAAFLLHTFPRFCQTLLPEHHGAATTFAAAEIAADGHAQICNVGNSRIYHIRSDRHWCQISRDHTVLADLLVSGEAQAGYEYADLYAGLTECLIADPEEDGFQIHTATCRLNQGDSLLLCSDGLTDSLPMPLIQQLWQTPPDLAGKLAALQTAVSHVSGHDDLSVVCIKIC